MRLSWFLATGKRYAELDTDYFTRRWDPDTETRRLIAKLETLGHRVTVRDAAA
jgi:transposase